MKTTHLPIESKQAQASIAILIPASPFPLLVLFGSSRSPPSDNWRASDLTELDAPREGRRALLSRDKRAAAVGSLIITISRPEDCKVER